MQPNTSLPKIRTLKEIKGIASDLRTVCGQGYKNKTLPFTETQRQMFRTGDKQAQMLSESLFPLPAKCANQFKTLQDIAARLPGTLTSAQSKNLDAVAVANSACKYIELVCQEAQRIEDGLDHSIRTKLRPSRAPAPALDV